MLVEGLDFLSIINKNLLMFKHMWLYILTFQKEAISVEISSISGKGRKSRLPNAIWQSWTLYLKSQSVAKTLNLKIESLYRMTEGGSHNGEALWAAG